MVPPLNLIFEWRNDACERACAFERLLGLGEFYLFESLGNKNGNLILRDFSPWGNPPPEKYFRTFIGEERVLSEFFAKHMPREKFNFSALRTQLLCLNCGQPIERSHVRYRGDEG